LNLVISQAPLAKAKLVLAPLGATGATALQFKQHPNVAKLWVAGQPGALARMRNTDDDPRGPYRPRETDEGGESIERSGAVRYAASNERGRRRAQRYRHDERNKHDGEKSCVQYHVAHSKPCDSGAHRDRRAVRIWQRAMQTIDWTVRCGFKEHLRNASLFPILPLRRRASPERRRRVRESAAASIMLSAGLGIASL
ncbi:hypothetical protein AURDEDRAFT_168813, partial [Auricularia subglabra TFB-10046 SS5]